MPTLDQLNEALLKADAAGDTQSAQLFAQMIKDQRGAHNPASGSSPAPANALSTWPEQDLVEALRKADAAGNTAGAQQIADIIKRQRAAGGVQAAPQPPQQSVPVQPTAENAPMSLLDSAVHTATFGLDRPAEAGIASLVYGAPFSQTRQLVEAQDTANEAAHPYASLAGSAIGLVPGAAVGGAVLRGAEALPLVGRAASAVRAAPVVPRIAATAATDAAVGASLGYAQGGKPGAVTGAIAGPLARPVATGVGAGARLLQGPTAAALRVIAKAVQVPGESLNQAAQRAADAAQEHISHFGVMPSLTEIVDATQAKEIGQTIGRRVEGQQTAAALEDQAAVARQGQLSSALASGGETAAQGTVAKAASQQLSKVMSRIDATPVTPTPEQTQFLKENEPEIKSMMRGSAYSTARGELEDHIDNGAPLSLRTIETMRLATSRAAKSPDPVVANTFRSLRDGVREIGTDAVPSYRDAMMDYGAQMRAAQNIPEGARGIQPSVSPMEFAGGARGHTGFDNQPNDYLGKAAQYGQTVGLRTALSQKVLQSPDAAAELSRSLSEDAGLQQKIRTAFPPAEASRVQRTGELALRAGRGMAAAVPVEGTKTAESQALAGHALRTAALGLHGGSTAFMSHNIEWLMSSLKLPLGTAKKVAQLAMDSNNTPAVLQYLRARGASQAQRHEFMDLVRSGAAASVGSAAGQFAAGAYPQ